VIPFNGWTLVVLFIPIAAAIINWEMSKQ